ncbi:hypothetical protein ANN_21259 [Periplaneta americana]|uniref:Uncharacterized protein n=1 Tax=Periplaneta americana TaxID=6978 RepID=A0ABQ8SG13_PERAM|nr:hypothetical protein ANN_21259 [Periplaneta americana]
MSPGSSTDSYPAFAHIGLRESPGKNLNQTHGLVVRASDYMRSRARFSVRTQEFFLKGNVPVFVHGLEIRLDLGLRPLLALHNHPIISSEQRNSAFQAPQPQNKDCNLLEMGYDRPTQITESSVRGHHLALLQDECCRVTPDAHDVIQIRYQRSETTLYFILQKMSKEEENKKNSERVTYEQDSFEQERLRKSTEILLEASKSTGLEVNPEKTNYMIMSRDQNIVRNGNIKIEDLSFEEVENLKNLKLRIYKIVRLPVVLYGCETWTLTLKDEQRLRFFENKVLRKILGAKRDEVTGEWRKLHNAELHALYCSPDIIRNIKSRRLRWAGHVAHMGESRNNLRDNETSVRAEQELHAACGLDMWEEDDFLWILREGYTSSFLFRFRFSTKQECGDGDNSIPSGAVHSVRKCASKLRKTLTDWAHGSLLSLYSRKDHKGRPRGPQVVRGPWFEKRCTKPHRIPIPMPERILSV